MQSASEDRDIEKDDSYTPSSERETERNQYDTVETRAGGAEGVTSDDVMVLPGTGGPDDTGDIEMKPGEYHPAGDAVPESSKMSDDGGKTN